MFNATNNSCYCFIEFENKMPNVCNETGAFKKTYERTDPVKYRNSLALKKNSKKSTKNRPTTQPVKPTHNKIHLFTKNWPPPPPPSQIPTALMNIRQGKGQMKCCYLPILTFVQNRYHKSQQKSENLMH